MKQIFIMLSIAVLSSSVYAAVGVGENLIMNGSFAADQVDFPEFWIPASPENVHYLPVGGPDGKKAAIVLRGNGSASIRQEGLTLVAGGVYKISAWIKTKGFKSTNGGLVIHNARWVDDVGLKSFPVDSDWTFLENEFTLFSSERAGEYGVAFFAQNRVGEITISDLRLEAISEDALLGSSSQMGSVSAPRLIPFSPLLNKIPIANPELTFQFYGVLPQPEDDYDCLITIVGNPIPQQTIPLQSGKILVNLTGLPCGDHTLEAILQHRETHETVLSVAYRISIITLPEIDRSAIKPLNNLVTELLNQPISTASEEQTLTFDAPRDGWVFMALVGSLPAASNLKVTLDGQDTVIATATDRLEAFREVEMGTHSITVSGATSGMSLLVRSIPEIFNYPPCGISAVTGNGLYDWDFMKQHILYAVTTLNGGDLPGDALPEAKARGLRWLANFSVHPISDQADIQMRMESTMGMTQPQYDGFTSDEIFVQRADIENYTKTLWELSNPEERLVYTWAVGKTSIPSLHTDFISACLNVSKGRGRLLYEAYCVQQADEAAANVYLDDMMGETMRRLNTFFPNAAAGTGMIFGNFNQIPLISLECNPDQDYKYYLDMQINRVANHPDFKDLATVGYWGTYYGDEELVRWSFKLMRHYAVEGRKDMLSDHYGFTYASGFLKNADFADGLNEWSLVPAAKDSIRAETLVEYGKNSQGRFYGQRYVGDTVCVMTRQAATTNRISQTAHGLTVGKAYSLQFVTADRTDVIKKRYNPRRYGIEAELDGVEPISDKSFVHIDKREKTRKTETDVGKVNLHRIVFRATSTEQTIVFHDANALPDEALCINFVQLKPYFE